MHFMSCAFPPDNKPPNLITSPVRYCTLEFFYTTHYTLLNSHEFNFFIHHSTFTITFAINAFTLHNFFVIQFERGPFFNEWNLTNACPDIFVTKDSFIKFIIALNAAHVFIMFCKMIINSNNVILIIILYI